jgi:hypothetical protein
MIELDDHERIVRDAEYREGLRHRFITDHFFAAKMLGFNGFHPVIHKPAVDLYFPKNSLLPIEEQDSIKNRMHLDPRFSFKTTLNRIDKVQWICAFPKIITVLNETATQPLAKAISKGIANFFYCPKYQKPSRFQLCFPELVVEKPPFGVGDTWSTPVHESNSLDETISYTSPQTEQSGWHPWVLNCDDMVATKNSGIRATQDARQGVIDTFDTNKNTLVPGGYLYLVGTRYAPFDLYGVRLNDMDPDLWKVLIRQSVICKDGARLLPGEFPAEDDVILPFNELPGMNYKRLRSMFFENYETFLAQQQNDPQGGHTPIFDEKLYGTCEANIERIPPYGGETFVCWRLPYGSKPATSKFLEGAAARILDGKVYVIDCWQIGGTPSHQAERMVQIHKRMQADGMMILNTPGSDGFAPHLRNEAARKNVSIRIRWTDWEDNETLRDDSIKQMEPVLKVGRILFARGMTKGGECKKQFVYFGLIEENGIIECISKLGNLVPRSQMRAAMEDDELEHQRRRSDDASLNWLLDLQGKPIVDEQAKRKTLAHVQAMQKATTYSFLPKMPGGLDG